MLRAYRLLLFLYAQHVRAVYGREMLADYARRFRGAQSSRPAGSLRLLLHEILHVVLSPLILPSTSAALRILASCGRPMSGSMNGSTPKDHSLRFRRRHRLRRSTVSAPNPSENRLVAKRGTRWGRHSTPGSFRKHGYRSFRRQR